MKTDDPLPEDLIAPCGMNCAVCSNYLAHVNGLDKSRCAGCRPSNKTCMYLFEKCSGINHALDGNADARFCFECAEYPCREIERMDRRYRENYAMSVKANLDFIKEHGAAEFARAQYEKYRCPGCDGLTSIHNRKCFKCDTVTKLVDKS